MGEIRVGCRGADENQEEKELLKVVHLDPEALAQVRGETLELEKRAYIYGKTSPAEPNPLNESTDRLKSKSYGMVSAWRETIPVCCAVVFIIAGKKGFIRLFRGLERIKNRQIS